jgi:phage RecT family recombinase
VATVVNSDGRLQTRARPAAKTTPAMAAPSMAPPPHAVVISGPATRSPDAAAQQKTAPPSKAAKTAQPAPPAKPAEDPRVVAFRAELKASESMLKAALPTTASLARFLQVAAWAVLSNVQILAFDPKQIIGELAKCARFGLVPDGREAVLVPYKDEKSSETSIKLQPMYQGILKYLRQSGEATSVSAEAIFERDTFEADTLALSVTYRKHMDGNPGKLVGGAAVFRNKAREIIHIEVLRKRDIEQIRGKAKTQRVWNEWLDEKVRISAIRRGSKYIPLMDESRALIELEDAMVDLDRTNHDKTADERAVVISAPERGLLREPSRAEIERMLADDADAEDVTDSTPPIVSAAEPARPAGKRSVARQAPGRSTGDPRDSEQHAAQHPDQSSGAMDDSEDRDNATRLVVSFTQALASADGDEWRMAVRNAYYDKIVALEKRFPDLHKRAMQEWAKGQV